jgi:hypothetical protein
MEELKRNPPSTNEAIADLNRHMINQQTDESVVDPIGLELKRKILRAGYLSYVVKLFRAVLLGYTDYRSAISANIANSADIANYYSVKYIENIQPTTRMQPANFHHHNESFAYFSLAYMALKISLDLEIMNGSVGV